MEATGGIFFFLFFGINYGKFFIFWSDLFELICASFGVGGMG
jgi:hypothetical protein